MVVIIVTCCMPLALKTTLVWIIILTPMDRGPRAFGDEMTMNQMEMYMSLTVVSCAG